MQFKEADLESLKLELKSHNLDRNILNFVDRNTAELKTDYFLKMMQFIGQKIVTMTSQKKQFYKAERIKFFQQKNWKQYDQIVKEEFDFLEGTGDSLMEKVFVCIKDDLQIFMMTYEKLSQDKKICERVLAAQQGKIDLFENPPLTKEQVLSGLQVHERVTRKWIDDRAEKSLDDLANIIIMEQRIKDECSIITGIDQEDFENSLVYYTARDQQISEALQAQALRFKEMKIQ